MATRSSILEKTPTGYRGIYCHWDGYLENNGLILHQHYQDPDKVRRLIDLGSLSELRERVEPIGPHSYDTPEKGTTIAYHRDRGEKYRAPSEGQTIQEASASLGHNGHIYVFEDGKWTYNGQDLAQCLNGTADQEP